MILKALHAAVILGCITMVGCEEKKTRDGESIVCTASVEPAITVAVFDKETGLPIACGSSVSVQDGDFFEEYTNESAENCDDSFEFQLAAEREGRYDVSVTKAGYVDWYQDGVVVSANICHVNTISIQAYLDK